MSTLFIGLISGTSLDAIDVALVEFQENAPLSFQVHAVYAHPWRADLRQQLLTLTQQAADKTPLSQLATLDYQVALQFAEAVKIFLAQQHLQAHQITALGHVGQTLFHAPQHIPPYTWQVGDPYLLAKQTQIPVVAEFRRNDVANGGQGAPLAPAFHAAAWRDKQEKRGILNIGGISNITVLPSLTSDEKLLGFDIGAGNALLDAWAQQHLQQAYDKDGQWARTAQACPELLDLLLQDEYLQRSPPKSTGRDYFNLTWLQSKLAHFSALSAAEVQATLVEFTAQSIVNAVKAYQLESLFVCGGGAHHHDLMQKLAKALTPCRVLTTDNVGVSADWVEAVTFAWFAHQRWQQLPIDLSPFTGAQRTSLVGTLFYP